MITEIGGTVGDIESLPFLEAIRQFPVDVGRRRCMFIHLTLVPYIGHAGELKTKPTQHSVNELRRIGIAPDMVVCRSESALSPEIRRKIALFASLPVEAVVSARDVEDIYQVPLVFHDEGVDDYILEHFGVEAPTPDLGGWEAIMPPRRRGRRPCGSRSSASTSSSRTHTCRSSRRSAMPGCTTAARSRSTGSTPSGRRAEVARGSERADGILIPGGFGGRGIEGKIRAAQIAREHGIPYLGICLGMQVAVGEFARHVAGMDGANSTEFDPETPFPVIDLLPEQKEIADMGGTMRLGADPIKLHEAHRVRELYGEAGGVRASPPPLRGQQPSAPPARGGRAGLLGDLARRAARRGDRAADATSTRSTWPRSTTPSSSPVPSVRRRCSASSWALRSQRPGCRSPPGAGQPPAMSRASVRPRRRVRRATDAERERLDETFAALCRIESPSGRERACADWVAAELDGDGTRGSRRTAPARPSGPTPATCSRDCPAGSRGASCCAPTSTRCRSTAPVDPVVVDGGWENADEGILGADNKAAVAVMLELARRLAGRGSRPRSGMELLFTVCEEDGLRGAKAFDRAAESSSATCSTTPPRSGRSWSPRRATTGSSRDPRPRRARRNPSRGGRSAIVAAARAIAAMRLGRLDAETTANVGTIAGGTNNNVVAERCRVEAEARSLDPARAEATATEIVDHLQEAADASECDLDITVERLFEGYRTRAREPQVALAEQALRGSGYEPSHIVTGGGSDANALQLVRLSVHEPRQRHRAQPRADRARQRRRARRDARGSDRTGRARAAVMREAGEG